MKAKNKIQVSIANWSSYELDGKLEDTIAKLQKFIDENPTFFDFQIEVESESGYYGSCSTYINVIAFRWETDQEFEDRLIAEKKASLAAKQAAKTRAENQAIKERQLYESLKRKFESEIDETNKMIKH